MVRQAPGQQFTTEVVIKPDIDSLMEYIYSISVEINETNARVISESLQRFDTGRSLYDTQGTSSGPSLATYFSTGKRGAPERLDQNPSFAVLSQIETMNIIKETKEVARKIREQLQSIFILDPIPSHMRGYSPLSDTLKSDASNIAGVLASLPEERRSRVEEILTTYLQALAGKGYPESMGRACGKIWFRRHAL